MMSDLSKLITSVLLVLSFIILIGCKSNEARVPATQAQNQEINNQTTENADSTTSDGFTLAEYDTPPEPIQNPMPEYPARFRRSGIQGVVVLDVKVGANGEVGEVIVKKSLMAGEGGLDDIAVTTVKTWLFKPALLKKRPVDSKVTIPVPFTLK